MKNKNRYFILIAVLMLLPLVYFSCKSSRTSPSSLRIVSINENSPLIVDVQDWYLVAVDTFQDPPDSTFDFTTKDWIVPIEVGYVETGLGLPTYPSPYTARCTSYTVNFRRIDISTQWRPLSVNGAINISIPTDPTATVQTDLKMIPFEWINQYLDTLALGCMVKATVVLSGYEELTHNPVCDSGYLTINFADYYDNPVLRNSK